MRQALLAVDGVVDAEVTFDPARAVVAYRSALVQAPALVRAVEESGFKAHVIEE